MFAPDNPFSHTLHTAPTLDQVLHNGTCINCDGIHQWSYALAIPHLHISTLSDEHARTFQLVLPGCMVQGAALVQVTNIHICPSLNQEFCALCSSKHDSIKKRSGGPNIAGIKVRLPAEKHSQTVSVSIPKDGIGTI
jgi:hypothetical protein